MSDITDSRKTVKEVHFKKDEVRAFLQKQAIKDVSERNPGTPHDSLRTAGMDDDGYGGYIITVVLDKPKK